MNLKRCIFCNNKLKSYNHYHSCNNIQRNKVVKIVYFFGSRYRRFDFIRLFFDDKYFQYYFKSDELFDHETGKRYKYKFNRKRKSFLMDDLETLLLFS